MQEMYQAKAHNVNIVSNHTTNSFTVETEQSVLNELRKLFSEKRSIVDFVTDLIGALSLFAMLYGGLILAEMFK